MTSIEIEKREKNFKYDVVFCCGVLGSVEWLFRVPNIEDFICIDTSIWDVSFRKRADNELIIFSFKLFANEILLCRFSISKNLLQQKLKKSIESEKKFYLPYIRNYNADNMSCCVSGYKWSGIVRKQSSQFGRIGLHLTFFTFPPQKCC